MSNTRSREPEFDELLDELFVKIGTRVSDPCLEYTIYKLLQEFDLKYMSKTRFYKILFLIYKNLKNKGLDIKLPYFWYEHGPVVDIYALPTTVEFRHDGVKNTPLPVPKPRTEIEYNAKRKIDETISTIKSKYERKDTEFLIDEVYKYAPLGVQSFFRKLLKHGLRGDGETINVLLTDIVREFPKKEYEDLYSVLLRIVPLVRYGIKNGVKLDELEDLFKIFWKTFCQKLSLSHNENLPNGLVRMPEMYKENMTTLKQKLKDVERGVLSSLDRKYEVFNPLFEKHLEDFLKSKGYI